MLVHQLITCGARDKVAFYGKQAVTYSQLQARVGQYRNYFYQQGVRRGDNVGLFSRNSVEYVYSYMAIASLGAVVVPLNFQLVAREIAYIVQDAKMKAIVTMQYLELDAELAHFGYPDEVRQLVIPEFSAVLDSAALKPAPAIESLNPEEVCVIIYTSGTTGNPKGAVLTHNNLISDARAFTEVLPVTAADNVLCVLPMYHCFSWTCAILASLLHGASITVLDTFSKETVPAVRDGEVTIVYAVPAMYNLFLAWGTAADFTKVRFFISGGASLPEQVARQFMHKFGKEVTEGYGLSEASPVVSLNPVGQVKYCSIGKAIPGVKVRIADPAGRDMPAGVTGELLVSGPIVMKGYYNLPEETAAALKDGWLHTGDLAYLDNDGYIFIVDRLKDMILVSGENVYPREIEELLYAYPGVAEAAVVGVPDKLRGQVACAYIVVKDGYAFDKKALREYLQANLAGYKVPKDYVQVDVLPKNGTGKIMKKVLREQAKKTFSREHAG